MRERERECVWVVRNDHTDSCTWAALDTRGCVLLSGAHLDRWKIMFQLQDQETLIHAVGLPVVQRVSNFQRCISAVRS